MIAHPPCNYLSNYITSFRPAERFDDWDFRVSNAVELFQECLNAQMHQKLRLPNPAVMNQWAKAHELLFVQGFTGNGEFSHYGDAVMAEGVGFCLIGPTAILYTQIPDAARLVSAVLETDVMQVGTDYSGKKP